MAAQTVVQQVLSRMNASSGSVWSAKDFLDLGSRAAVDQSLKRLSSAGRIRKVARGLYDYPQTSGLVGKRQPKPDAVATAAARARGATVRPTGAAAANALGLSTQVPASADYITDGPARAISVGARTVRLKRVSPSRLALPGGAGALVEALRHIGKSAVRNLDADDFNRVAAALTAVDMSALRKAMHHAPDWMHPAITGVISARASSVTGD